MCTLRESGSVLYSAYTVSTKYAKGEYYAKGKLFLSSRVGLNHGHAQRVGLARAMHIRQGCFIRSFGTFNTV